jgi:hypothetical protein
MACGGWGSPDGLEGSGSCWYTCRGSSTAFGLRKRWVMRVWWGAVAQLGERLVRNEEVSGSIPLSSTKESITCDNMGIDASDTFVSLFVPKPFDVRNRPLCPSHCRRVQSVPLRTQPAAINLYQASKTCTRKCRFGRSVISFLLFPESAANESGHSQKTCSHQAKGRGFGDCSRRISRWISSGYS